MAQYGFYFNMKNCTGCKCCVFACKNKHDLEVGFNFRKVTYYEGGTFPDVWAATLSMACNHCAVPACQPTCPVSAITKDEATGLVSIDQELCIGCESCVSACPYAAPVFFSDAALVNKCNGCLDLVAKGETPLCVAGCTTRCLDFGDLEELKAKYGADLVKEIEGMPSAATTDPSFLILPREELA